MAMEIELYISLPASLLLLGAKQEEQFLKLFARLNGNEPVSMDCKADAQFTASCWSSLEQPSKSR